MAIVLKRAIVRKRAMASNNNNKMTATETTTTTSMTNATYNNNDNDADNDDKDKDNDDNNDGVAVAAGSGWRRLGRATKAAAAGVECSYFSFLSKQNSGCCWLLGEGEGRQAGSKPEPRKVHVRRN